MSERSVPSRDSACQNLQNPTRTKRKSVSGSESTPGESSSLPGSPRPKHSRSASRGKENDFVSARRSRRSRRSAPGISWDHLPDESLLRIYFCLPSQDSSRVSAVCRRWRRSALDESSWHSVDSEGSTRTGPASRSVSQSGVQRSRCPRAFVEESQLTEPRPSQSVESDSSSSIISASASQSIVCGCRRSRCLSSEASQLSDGIISCSKENRDSSQLNSSGCSGFSAAASADSSGSCCSLEQSNISWCSFSREHVQSVVTHSSPSVAHSNSSGYRENSASDDVKVSVDRCPDIETSDLSDSTLSMADCFPVSQRSKKSLHSSLSRCYHIHSAALSDSGKMIPSSRFSDVFGFIQDSQSAVSKRDSDRVSINSRPFSSVARPTPAGRTVASSHPDRTMWSRRCRSRVPL